MCWLHKVILATLVTTIGSDPRTLLSQTFSFQKGLHQESFVRNTKSRLYQIREPSLRSPRDPILRNDLPVEKLSLRNVRLWHGSDIPSQGNHIEIGALWCTYDYPLPPCPIMFYEHEHTDTQTAVPPSDRNKNYETTSSSQWGYLSLLCTHQPKDLTTGNLRWFSPPFRPGRMNRGVDPQGRRSSSLSVGGPRNHLSWS